MKPKSIWLTFILAALFPLTLAVDNWQAVQNPDIKYSDGEKAMSEVTIHLPVHACSECRRVYHTVAAYNGCYKWKVSHDQYIEMKEYRSKSHPECTNIVEVAIRHPKKFPQVVWLSAQDLRTGQVLRAEIRAGYISRLEIHQKSKQISKGEHQTLNVLAYDEQGNHFSSVNGFKFDWTILEGHESIVRVSAREIGQKSEHQGHNHEVTEESEKNRDDFFCKGLKPGSVSVQVKMIEQNYESVKAAKVNFIVAQPFEVVPDPNQMMCFDLDFFGYDSVYIMPTSDLQLKLAHVHMGEKLDLEKVDVELPSPQYVWSLSEPTKKFGQINQKGLFSATNLVGSAEVIVNEKEFVQNMDSLMINIVEPFSLKLELCDVTENYGKIQLSNSINKVESFARQLNATHCQKNWIIVEGKTYLVRVKVLDQEDHQLVLTKNLLIDNKFDTKIITLLDKNSINSEFIIKVTTHSHEGEALPAHKTILKSILKEIKCSANCQQKYTVDQKKLSDEKEITITGPVKILHPTQSIILPRLYLDKEQGEQWHLQAIGGTGRYVWSSENPAIAKITEPSRVWSVNLGQTYLTVHDLYNEFNSAKILVEVEQVHHLMWLESRIEVLKQKESALLNAIAVDSKGRKFTNCTSLEMDFTVKGDSKAQETNVKGDWTTLQSYVNSEEGMSRIKLRHRFDLQQSAQFEDSLTPKSFSKKEEEVLTHNNFGICDQILIQAEDEGITVVTAGFAATPTKTVESEKAEVGAFQSLETLNPDYRQILDNLYSNQQAGQEFQTFASFEPVPIGGAKKFVQAFGTTFEWVIRGGANFWKELKDEYESTWNIELVGSTTRQNVLNISLKQQGSTNSTIAVGCKVPDSIKTIGDLKVPYEYRINLLQKSKVSRYLLSPKQHKHQVYVSCEPPSTQRLLWSQPLGQDRQARVQLPRSRLVQNTRTHYVLTRSSHNLRYLVLSKQGYAFVNHQSLISEVRSTDISMAHVKELGYDSRVVEFGNHTGTVELQVKSSAYVPELISHIPKVKKGMFSGSASEEELNSGFKVQDTLFVKVVDNVQVTPSRKAIYFLGSKNTFKFQLLLGSGHFQVHVNDSSLAGVQHVDREVTIIPKRIGSVRLIVEDTELPESQPAYSEILISDISSLHLESQGYLVEQGDSLNMTVTAFDHFGEEFDFDQYQKIDFALEIEMTGIRRTKGIHAEKVAGQHRLFTITGVEPGNYIVTAVVIGYSSTSQQTTDEHPRRIASQDTKIEVFPFLTLQPASLLLTPNMKYTLSISGGPSRGSYGSSVEGSFVDIKFEIENATVASIDSVREITAHHVGNTQLLFTIVQTKTSREGKEWYNTVSRRVVPIRVRLVSLIEIPHSQQRLVYTGSMLKQLAVLKFRNESSNIEEIFAHGVAPISWEWSCSHPNILVPNFPGEKAESSQGQHHVYTRVIRDNSKRDNNAVFSTSFNSSSIHANALKTGEALLNVRMAIEYPDYYNRDKNWFETSTLIKVQDRLSINVPEFIPDSDRQTHLYLLPPHSKSKIATNKNTQLRLGYSMQSLYDSTTEQYKLQESQAPIIKLEEDQTIRTFDKYGKVTVIVEEKQAPSDQLVMLNILITDIYTLAAYNFAEALSLPLGSTVSIPLKFYNEHAHLFANKIEGVQVALELSHPRVVSAQLDHFNSTLTLISEGSGECMVLIYLVNNPAIFDVLKVKVATIVQPSSPVHVHIGADISFKVVKNGFEGLQRQGVTWSSSNPSVLSIDIYKGTARANSEGKAEILLSDNINAASIIHVSKVKHAELDSTVHRDLILNVDERGEVLKPRVKLFLANQIEELMPVTQYEGVTLIRQNVQLKCESDHPEYLQATAETSDIEGYFCNIKFTGSRKKSYQDVDRKAKITVSVAAGSKPSKSYDQELMSFEIKLISNIYIEDAYKRGINLGQFTRQKSLRVLSLADFSVNSTVDESQLKIGKFRDQQNPNEFNLTFIVPKSFNKKMTTVLRLVNSATSEEQKLALTFDPNDLTQKPVERPAQSQWVQSERDQVKQVSFEPKSKSEKQEPPFFVKLFITLVLLCIALVLAKDTELGIWVTRLIGSILGFFNINLGYRFQSHYAPGGRDRSFGSFITANDRSRSIDQSRDTKNFYAQVRERYQHTSPDAKIYNNEQSAPVNRFNMSKGSVVSPQSMFRRADSIYRESHY